MTINLLFFFFLFIILNKIAHSKGLIKVVLLVLVQNFAARGLVQKPSNYSLSSVRYIEKKHKKQQKSLHFNIKKFLWLFLFNNSLEPTN